MTRDEKLRRADNRQRRERYKTDPQYRKAAVARAEKWAKRNKKRRQRYLKTYKERNRPRFYAAQYRSRARRLRRDPVFRASFNLRCRITRVLKGNPKAATTLRLVGCTRDFLRGYIEAQFEDGMTWENYGQGKGKWEIDHIIPCCGFDLSKPEEQKACFHYSNLQPLWSLDNRLKSGRILHDARRKI